MLRSDVVLFALTIKEAPVVYQWLSEPEIRSAVGLREEPTLVKTQTWFLKIAQDKTALPYGILFQGKHVGNVILDQIKASLLQARLWLYIVDKQARGKGVGETAVGLALKEGFEKKGLKKIWLHVDPENKVALKLYKKVGFQLEKIVSNGLWQLALSSAGSAA